MLDYTLTINGVDFTSMIDRDSYQTSRIPIYSERITTIDGVDHIVMLRNKSALSFSLNPQTAAQTKAAYNALIQQPCEVYFFNLQTQEYQSAYMITDRQTAEYLSRCLYKGLKWNQIGPVTFEEL